MIIMNTKSLLDYIIYKRLAKTYPDCSVYNLSLTEEELAIAKTYYWLRNKKLGLDGARNLDICCGPKGHMVVSTSVRKMKYWFPHPDEFCGYESTEIKGKFHPYALYRHCNTIDHIKYLAKFKTNTLIERADGFVLSTLMRIMCVKYEELPLIINEFNKKSTKNEYYKMLISDRLNKICQMES